jgi:flagellar hook-associated protein 1 FlgK
MSTFSGLSSALSALYANRRGMEVTAHNIANVSTPGYTRQRADLKAIGGQEIPGRNSPSEIGSGVQVSSVQRLRDAFLESRGRLEHAQAEYLAGQQQVLGRVEQAFAEPSDTAMQAQLTELWASFADLANRPAETSTRTAVLARANIVADTMKDTAGQLSAFWDTTRSQLNGIVAEINNTAVAVAELNTAVVASQVTGHSANDLIDQRDQLVLKLSELTGARATNRPDGSVDLQLNGSSLVSGSTVRTLDPPSGALSLAGVQGGGAVELRWSDPPKTLAGAPSGKLASVMEAVNTTLPHYANRLDEIARSLVTTVNEQHAKGIKDNGAAGGLFFGPDPDPDPLVVTASNIRVEVKLPSDLAVADSTAEAGAKDGGNADKLADLAKDADGPDGKYRQLVVDLGVAAQTINRRVDIQGGIVSQIDAARDGESGVNLDEEMSNLVAFERAYQAASKVISTIDEMLDTLINRMGR